MEEREAIKNSFYEGPIWEKDIEPKAMSMIEHMEAELTETTDDFESFSGDRSLS